MLPSRLGAINTTWVVKPICMLELISGSQLKHSFYMQETIGVWLTFFREKVVLGDIPPANFCQKIIRASDKVNRFCFRKDAQAEDPLRLGHALSVRSLHDLFMGGIFHAGSWATGFECAIEITSKLKLRRNTTLLMPGWVSITWGHSWFLGKESTGIARITTLPSSLK